MDMEQRFHWQNRAKMCGTAWVRDCLENAGVVPLTSVKWNDTRGKIRRCEFQVNLHVGLTC